MGSHSDGIKVYPMVAPHFTENHLISVLALPRRAAFQHMLSQADGPGRAAEPSAAGRTRSLFLGVTVRSGEGAERDSSRTPAPAEPVTHSTEFYPMATFRGSRSTCCTQFTDAQTEAQSGKATDAQNLHPYMPYPGTRTIGW